MSVLAALFVQAGISMHAQVPPATDYGYSHWLWQVNDVRNPYGHVVVGLEREFSRKFSARIYIAHESAFRVADYGTDSAGVAITWRPFR